MLLRRHLVGLESGVTDLEISKKIAAPSDLIGTAQAAQMLGYSRPYVAMLIDQNQLKGATVSAGGHRRVSRTLPSMAVRLGPGFVLAVVCGLQATR